MQNKVGTWQVTQPVKMVDECEPRILAVIIDSSDVHEEIETKVFAGESAHFPYTIGHRNSQRQLATELGRGRNQVRKPVLELFGEFGSGDWHDFLF